MKKIKRAIISLSNKENLGSILKTLNKYKIEINIILTLENIFFGLSHCKVLCQP